ncbi:response regulator transcription factor [Actinocorallia lasiicapitis]
MPASWLASLTAREHEVVALLARGLTDRQVARQLMVGESTIKKHGENARRKAGAANRSQLVAEWARSSTPRHGSGRNATP